jgi:menaquinone-9 beta-reductase
MTPEKFDVVIVGGGPAGTVAALYLAKAGVSVAIVDKCQFPRHKTCGDFIAPFAITFLQEWNFWSRFTDRDMYPVQAAEIRYFGQELARIRFASENPEATSVIISRYSFDHALMDLAISQGVAFVHGHAIGLLHEGDVIIGVQVAVEQGNIEIRARVVIGADGSNSKIASLLHPRQLHPVPRAIAMRAYIDHYAAKPNTVEAFFRKDFWPGYAWIFPVSETKVNIGLGYRLDDKRCKNKNLKQEFMRFLESESIASRMGPDSHLSEMRAKLLNLGFDRHYQRSFDGALLAGDAANLVNPLTGGGICNAMISGKLAAETIIKALAKNDISRQQLAVYEDRVTAIMYKELLYSEYLARFFYAAPPAVIRLLNLSIKRGPLPFIMHNMFPDVRLS